MPKLNLNTAESTRIKLTIEQQRRIHQLYQDAAQQVQDQIDKYSTVSNGTAFLQKERLTNIQKQLNHNMTSIGNDIKSGILGSMKGTADAVIEDNKAWLKKVGFPTSGAFSRVPDEVVRSVATGQVYEGQWSLDKAIWNLTNKSQADINYVVAQGIALNKSAYDIAKDLEKYVNPSAKKEWDWSKVYPGTNKKVDYSAQRLARTMVSHAYQQAFVRSTQNNPFVSDYIWHSSGSRPCELCQDRDGKHFEKGSLPMDHPNGMCTFEAVLPSMDEIADRLADWVNGKEDTELDEYMVSVYDKSATKSTKAKSTGKSSESIKASIEYFRWVAKHEEEKQ